MEAHQKIIIKGMVCQRCVTVVKTELLNFGLSLKDVTLGMAIISGPATTFDRSAIANRLEKLGFALVEDHTKGLIDTIKHWVALVYSGDFDFPERFRFSKLLASTILKDYDTISETFSRSEQQTLESYIINYKIAKTRELLERGDSLSTIAFKLGYSSVGHLSRQFKSNTGINPSEFRNVNSKYSMQVA